ncbi:MAG: sodium:proton antiporter [Burkholderiales bacterium]|nr:sodium:proton antiporter [Burkholderiales bacterium]
MKISKAALAVVALGLAPVSAYANLPGPELSLWWAFPFAGILLSIALFPLFAPHFWHKNYGKVALFWALLCAVPLYIFFPARTSTEALAHALLGDYIPFIIFVGSLFVVAGGIHLKGTFVGKPGLNTAFLAIGAVLANFMGTTGAAMLLIRPLIGANDKRHYQMHTYIFFIFIVANIAGSLTPLGDPPLFLGFLRGVTFFWTAAHLWEVTGLAVLILLVIYYCLDTVLLKKEIQENPHFGQVDEQIPIAIEGSQNFILLACIIGAVLLSGFWKTNVEFHFLGVHMALESIVRDLIFLLAAIASMLVTKKEHRQANQFTWEPILEVGKLFFGIFVTIVPVLEMLRAGHEGAFSSLVALVTNAQGEPVNAAFFWLTGMLSSFLDNAPTYLAFFNLAGGDPQVLMGPEAHTLMAISMGAVFMGAMTFIGNAPNFMVISIVQNRGIKMPSFFGYMIWSYCILIPLFLLLTFIYLI